MWAATLVVFAVVVRIVLGRLDTGPGPGAGTFGFLVLFLLLLLLMVVPALGAQSINGDRARRLLAPLQVTLLSPAEIALGKLAGAWATALACLAAALPAVALTVAMGGLELHRVAAAFVVLAVLAGALAAVAQCLSALVVRTTASAVLSYVTVFGLTAGSFFATQSIVNVRAEHNSEDIGAGWMLIAVNPFAILADAVPRPTAPMDPATGLPRFVPQVGYSSPPWDPLEQIRREVRLLRSPDDEWFDYEPHGFYGDDPLDLGYRGHEPGPVWPYGLAAYAAVGAGAVAVTTRRLRSAGRSLPRGARVA